MEFVDRVLELGEKIERERDQVGTEQAAKTAFVLPFLQILGYDIFNPNEVIPEHVADWAKKKGEKVDYAIKLEDKTVMLFECKAVGDKLDAGKANQLGNYFNHVTDASIGVLTDGVTYKFYTDLNEKNIMDEEPFLIFDFDKKNNELVKRLEMFSKDRILGSEGREEIEKLRNYSAALQVIKEDFENPSEEWAKHIIHQIPFLTARSSTIKEFQGHLKKIVEHQNKAYFKSQLDKLRGQEETEEKPEKADEVEEKPFIPSFGADIEFENTDGMWHEFQGLTVVRSILHGTIPPSKITIKDWKGFCSVIYGGKALSVIVKMYFNRADEGIMYIEFPDKDDLGKIKIPNVQGMNEYRNEIIESAKRFVD